MVANMLRKSSAFERARAQLTPDSFSSDERWLAMLWACCGEHFDEAGRIPTKSQLVARFNGRLTDDPDSLSDEDLEEAEQFVSAAYTIPLDDLEDGVAFTWLRKFLEDRLASSIRETFSSLTVPANITEQLGLWVQQAGVYQSLAGSRQAEPFPDGWENDDMAGIVTEPTDISFVDSFIDGGDAPGEVCGLLGPFGGGKTTIGVMLSAYRARRNYSQWLASGRTAPRALSMHFSYEEPIGSLRIRVLSCVAKIPRKRLNQAISSKNLDMLSTRHSLESYEQRIYARALSAGAPVPGERERLEQAKRMLNACWRVYDMTGADVENPGRGSGLVDEIAALVRQELEAARRTGEPVTVRTVLVDYVLACIERNTDDHDALRHYIRRFPLEMKAKIAAPFQCTGWLLHQLNTDGQSLPPGRLPKRGDAAEGRAFAERLDFLFGIGNGDRQGMAAWGPLKTRREKPAPPIVVQLDGSMCVIRDQRRHYAIDERSHRIVTRDEQQMIGGGPVAVLDDEDAVEEQARQAAAYRNEQAAIRRNRPEVMP